MIVPRTYRFSSKKREGIARYIAESLGVTLEHLRATIKKRFAYRAGRRETRRTRRRSLMINPLADARHGDPTKMRSGEGELHGYLRMFGLSLQKFSELIGMSYSCVKAWSGFPLYAWPVEFLRMYGWSMAMAEKLRSMGVDPEQFRPEIPSKRLKGPSHPRKNGDLVLNMPGEYSPYKR